jgi:cation diffusion facilitator family transporter
MRATTRMAWLSIATSIATLVLKFGAWYLTGAVSLWSDALEALVNLAAGLVALGALTLAARPADAGHAFGHDKAEYFASGVEGTLILVAAVSIIVSAAHRFLAPQALENLGPGLVVAFVAGAMNYATARLMLRVAHEHESIAIEADARHLLTDVWTSVGVIGALVVVMLKPSWAVLDPVMAIAVGVHIVFIGVHLLRRSADGLMDASLPDAEIAAAQAAIRAELPGNASFHALRTRKAGARRFIEFHLTLPGAMSVAQSHALCDRIETGIAARLARAVVTIHVEPHETHDGASADAERATQPAHDVSAQPNP